MKQRRLIWPRVLLILIVLLLGIIFRASLIAGLLLPAAALLRGIGRILASVDQNVYWYGLIIFFALLVSWLALSRRRSTPNPTYNYDYKPPARTTYWRALIEAAATEDPARAELRKTMVRLYRSIQSDHEHPDKSGSEPSRHRSTPPFSAHAADFLYPTIEMNAHPFQNLKQVISRLTPRWLRRMNNHQIRQHQIIITEILTWMESELEIKNERN